VGGGGREKVIYTLKSLKYFSLKEVVSAIAAWFKQVPTSNITYSTVGRRKAFHVDDCLGVWNSLGFNGLITRCEKETKYLYSYGR
jgi:hypothetical protein